MAERIHRAAGVVALALGAIVASAPTVPAQSAADVAPATKPAPAPDADADNTAANARDRDGTTVTPLDQSNDPGDVAITRHVRQAVVANDNLSTNAQNVKIITIDGVVTLRGPVKTTEEREFVLAAAKGAPQVRRVDDQLAIEDDGPR